MADGMQSLSTAEGFPDKLAVRPQRQNYADKRTAFTSMPKDRLIIVPVSEWMRRRCNSHS